VNITDTSVARFRSFVNFNLWKITLHVGYVLDRSRADIPKFVSIPKVGLNFMLSLTVKKLDAYKFDAVAESDNTNTAIFLCWIP